MYEILEATQFSEKVFEMKVYAPHVARAVKPGQFFIVRAHERGERVPFTFSDWNVEEGWVKFVWAVIGKTSDYVAHMKAGEKLCDFVGPLGNPSHLTNGKWILVGGGAGIATTYPVARELCAMGAEVTVIIGARTFDLLIMEKELSSLPLKQFIIMTDDGSYGEQGLVTEALERLCGEDKYDQAFVVGPVPMMKFTTMSAAKFDLPIYVSLNPIMVDGTGMCGSCRCNVGGKTKFACIDGPDFDGHAVDWDLLRKRSLLYFDQERAKHEEYLESIQA
jgi:ferredoxin--NADP+ reductase